MPPEYEISTDPARLDIPLIHGFLTQSYWAQGRSLAVVEHSIRNSLCFGVFQEGRQVAFARVITDFAAFAYLADLFVLPEHRGQGIAKAMTRAIVDHTDLQGIEVFLLRTQDAHGLYARFGFESLPRPNEMMGRYKHRHRT